MAKTREQPETGPVRNGTRWTRDEDTRLIDELVGQGMGLEDIATVHARSANAIRSRVLFLAMRDVDGGFRTEADACSTYGVSAADLAAFRERQAANRAQQGEKPTAPQAPRDPLVGILREIRDAVLGIAKKLGA